MLRFNCNVGNSTLRIFYLLKSYMQAIDQLCSQNFSSKFFLIFELIHRKFFLIVELWYDWLKKNCGSISDLEFLSEFCLTCFKRCNRKVLPGRIWLLWGTTIAKGVFGNFNFCDLSPVFLLIQSLVRSLVQGFSNVLFLMHCVLKQLRIVLRHGIRPDFLEIHLL